MRTRGNPWLVREPDPGGQARLFCLPFAGSGASAYRHWPRRIGDVEVCPVQLPGRETRIREKSKQDFDDFAIDAAAGLLPYLDRPFALFGHCMGALLAYALLVRLQETGGPLPGRLIVSASLVPSRGFYGVFRPDMTDAEVTVELERVVAVTGSELDPDLLPLAIRILRNDVGMCSRYRPPGPYPLVPPITALWWTADPDVREVDAAEWADYGATVHRTLPGDSLTFLTAPASLVDVVRADTAELVTGSAADRREYAR
jgi:surfactin synthase thioesterase subunit